MAQEPLTIASQGSTPYSKEGFWILFSHLLARDARVRGGGGGGGVSTKPKDEEGRAMALKDGTKENSTQSKMDGNILSNIMVYAFRAALF